MNNPFIASPAEVADLHGANQMTASSERLLTVEDVACWLGVSKGWIYDHTTRKKPFLPCVRMGEVTRFRSTDVEAFIREHAKGHGSSART